MYLYTLIMHTLGQVHAMFRRQSLRDLLSPFWEGCGGGEGGERLLFDFTSFCAIGVFFIAHHTSVLFKKIQLKNALGACNLSLHYKEDTGDSLGLGLFAGVSDVC